VILAQQMQLDGLRKQVEEWQLVVNLEDFHPGHFYLREDVFPHRDLVPHRDVFHTGY
jgi:hypothetical protein